MPLQRPTWPNNAKIAVTLTFDNFGESFDLLRWGHAFGALADGVYAPRRGIERILDLLDKYHLPGTFFLEGWNVRKYPDLAREIVARGHEIAAHGWMHEQWNELTPEHEQELIRRTTETIADVLGERPIGWRTPSGYLSSRTLEYVHDAGYLYESAFIDEDIPYALQVAAHRSDDIVILPLAMSLDDGAFYAYPGTLHRPADVVAQWIEEFDAASQMTGYFMLVCHPRYSGRPARLLALERIVNHILEHDGAWFARCREVADHARADPNLPRYEAPAVMEEQDR